MSRMDVENAEAVASEQMDGYLSHIAHLDLPLSAKIEMVSILHEIMRSFVDRAFGDDAAQLARKGGDEIDLVREASVSRVISSGHHNTLGDNTLSAAFEQRTDRGRQKEKCQP
ncbi:hypothetical protein GCM10007908_04030 [Rhizobium albus]|nr:hypothetical protein GCM10007908_04030 [Rhizobium albus]